MLIEQTLEKLVSMRLHGMSNALRQWHDGSKDTQLDPGDLVGLLADAEWTHRENNKLTARLRKAKFKFKNACLEDIFYRPGRGLTKATVNQLASSRWVAMHKTIILDGPTGAGKTYIACALGQKACRDGYGTLASIVVSRIGLAEPLPAPWMHLTRWVREEMWRVDAISC